MVFLPQERTQPGQCRLRPKSKYEIVKILLSYRKNAAYLPQERLPIRQCLECVFTTDEETGLVGAETLDKSQISARTMINLDSEEEGVATVSCAGGVVVTYTCPIAREHKTGSTLTLDISGLLGGHSGSDINLERGNGNLIMARIIDRLMVAGEPAIVMNDSAIHEDVMIGAPDTNVIGTTKDGKEVTIFTNGEWAF